MSDATARKIGIAALLLAFSQLLSRGLGFVREAVIAGLVGRGRATDAYNAAFQVPDILFHLLAGGALSIAFIPLYERIKQERGTADAERFLATVLGTMTTAALAITIVLWLTAEALIALQFPRFEAAAQQLTTALTRIVLPAQVFFIAGGILRGALMAENRFGSQAAAPILYNLFIITGGVVGVWLGAAGQGIAGFAWGALVGAAFGSLGSALVEARGRLRIGFRVAPFDKDFRRYLVVAAPLLLGVSLITVDEWYDRWFGGLLTAGAIATLAFARRLMQLPVGLIGQAVATAALPTFTRLLQQGEANELARVVLRTLQATTAIAVLLAAGTAAIAEPLVRVVYVRGAFTGADAAPVTLALQVLCFGIPGWVMQTVAVRPFHARADMWRPMLLASVFVLLAYPLYLLLSQRLAILGLALAGAIAITLNAIATVLLARRMHGAPALGPLVRTLLRSLGATVPVALVVHSAVAWLGDRYGAVDGLGALLVLTAGGVSYLLLALPLFYLFGDDTTRGALRDLGARLRRILRRSG